MQNEFPSMAMANSANLAKTEDGKQNEFCSLAMANLANLANFDSGDNGFSRFSQKSHSHPAKVNFSAENSAIDLPMEQGGEFSRFSQISLSHSPEFNFSASHRRLPDSDLADLITRTAKTNGLDPLDVWRWMDIESIEDVRGGDPAVIVAFRACVESAVKCDTLTPPAVPHGLPFPGDQHQGDTEAGQIRCCDCAHQEPTDHPALVRCGAGRAAPGACGLWWATDRHTCPLFAARTSTDDQLRTAAANVDKTLATLGHTKCGAVDTSDVALEKLQADLDRLIRERANPQSPVILAFQAMGATVKFVDAKPVEDEATTSEATP
jgi:hypothetical protein